MMPRRSVSDGLALVELMVALAIGLLLILVSTALLLATRSAYLLHDDRVRIEESGRYAIDLVSRAVRQAGYRDWSAAGAGIGNVPAAVSGLDAQALKEATDGIAGPYGSAVNGSDVLALRFDGSGAASGDGSMLNCAGTAVAADEAGGGWSIFYVAKDSGGEPELRCKYRGSKGWNSEALVRGIEDFQVLYGIDSDGDGVPRRYASAAVLEREAAGRPGLWQSVAAVKIALLARGAQPGPAGMQRYDLFGAAYADANSADQGVRIDEAQLPAASRRLMRSLYAATIHLRNRGGDAP
jgi:type IV pilus assembly protein PilW